MSTPDKVPTRNSYLMNLVFINQKISCDCSLPEEMVAQLNKDVSRLKMLIEAIDAELLHE